MSLFSVVQGAANSLRVNQLGLQVVGNNIANVNTPGYIRQELIQSPATGYHAGDLIIGQGVQAIGVQQKVDNLILDRLRQTQSQLSYQEQLEGNNTQIESLLNELTDQDFSSNLTRFSAAFQDVANQPGSESVRTLALQRGQELATRLQDLSKNLASIADDYRSQISSTTSDINRVASSIATLNQRIVEMEGGSISNSDAVGLRDERLKALDELSSLIDIRATEQLDGSVSVFAGGDYLVTNASARKVDVHLSTEGGVQQAEVRFDDTDAPLAITGGKLRGLYEASKTAQNGGLQSKLNSLASDLIRVVNRIHSQGQGSKAFSTITGETSVVNPAIALEQSNPNMDISNGSFQIKVTDKSSNITKTYDIPVKQQGLSSDSTAQSIVASINAASGISASITNSGQIKITSASDSIQFSFANDTSGALAALGINTFFTGTNAQDIAVRQGLIDNPGHLAVSLDGVGNGASNANKIAEAFTQASDLLGGRSISGLYDSMISDTTRQINEQKGVTDGLRNFQQSLEATHMGISGVNLDEEAIKMTLFQRAFQASSKLVSVANDMLDALVNLI